MKKVLSIELSGHWILDHREDEVLPVQVLVNSLQECFSEGCSLNDTSLAEMKLIVDDEILKTDDVKKKLKEIFREKYPKSKFNDVITIEESEFSEESKPAKEEGVFTADGKEETSSESKEKDDKKVEKILGSIDELVGAEEFKSLAKEVACIAPQLIQNKTVDVFTHRSYLFSVPEGQGLSTFLELFCSLINAVGLCEMAPTFTVVEEKLTLTQEGMESFKDVFEHVYRNGGNKKIRILCIDISAWMDKTDNRFFKEFLEGLEKHTAEWIYVFRVPFVEKDVLDRLRASLNDLMFIRLVSCPPFTEDDVRCCTEKEIKSYGFGMDDSVWQTFYARILEEKRDGKFYGLHTIKKVVRELLYYKQLKNAENGTSDLIVNTDDALCLCGDWENASTSAREALDDLVGNSAVKEKIDEIVAQIQLSKKAKDLGNPCIHMRFVGNPGTGKTTVARIIGKLLKEQGVLRLGNFYEYAGRDLCGRYIGETAPKTASICRDAYGSVLFIDEAYALYKGEGNEKDYGREALDTLIAEMENHRSDFIVIMAGYPDEMKTLMEGNAGLASRMPYVIEFPNFTREQLFEIYIHMMKGRFQYDKEMKDAVKEYFNAIPDDVLSSKEFSNARFVRNLFERTWAKAAMRSQLEKTQNVTLTKDDFERAVLDKEFSFNEKIKTRLGF